MWGVIPEVAYDYFYKRKWPNGYACPDCGFRVAYIISSRNQPIFQCKKCKHQTTLTAGTILEKSRTPLHKWMTAVKLLCQPNSVNAVQLQSILGVTYKTAFYMLRKIRMVLTNYDRNSPLSGNVHASYKYPKTRYHASPVCKDAKEVPVMIAGSFDGQGNLAYLKMKPGLRLIAHTEYGIKKFKSQHVDPSCRQFEFHHGGRIYNVQPFVQLLSQVCTWIGRTFKGVSRNYIEHYLDEFSYRINREMKPDRIQNDICYSLMNPIGSKISRQHHAA